MGGGFQQILYACATVPGHSVCVDDLAREYPSLWQSSRPCYVANDLEVHASIVSESIGRVNANKSPNA